MTASRARTDPRISRRRAAIARSRRRALAIRCGVVVVLAGLVWTAFWSPLLVVRKVKVSGAKYTTSAQVAEAAHLSDSDNLLLVSTANVEAAAESLPWVASADVDRMLPGTIRVRVTEREPALVLAIGAARWTIDESGRVLATGEVVAGLPVIGGVTVEGIRPGAVLDGPEVVDALTAWRSLPDRLADRVRAVFAPTIERISFALHDGTLVRYGAAERLTAKNRVLLAVMARLASEGRVAAYIDVRVPTNPAVAQAPPVPVPTPMPAVGENADSAESATPRAAEADEPADGY